MYIKAANQPQGNKNVPILQKKKGNEKIQEAKALYVWKKSIVYNVFPSKLWSIPRDRLWIHSDPDQKGLLKDTTQIAAKIKYVWSLDTWRMFFFYK